MGCQQGGRVGSRQGWPASWLGESRARQEPLPAPAGGLQAGEATRREVSPWGTELQQVARMPGWVESREKQA